MSQSMVYSVYGVLIRLTDERWEHVASQHPEMSDLRLQLLETIETPERILEGNDGEYLAIRRINHVKWLVVVYRERDDDGFVITAFITKRERSLEKRTVLWQSLKST